jgi:hypothetical protein
VTDISKVVEKAVEIVDAYGDAQADKYKISDTPEAPWENVERTDGNKVFGGENTNDPFMISKSREPLWEAHSLKRENVQDCAPQWKVEDGIKAVRPHEVFHLPGEKDNPSFTSELIKNKEDGLRRESEVEDELKKKYPESEGYTIEKEVYLRDKDGNIVRDPVTGEARRIDFVVLKDGKVVDSIEVTSKTAPKDEQTAKENRIRENGGNYIRDSNGNLVEIPPNVQTRIVRRD